MTIRQLLLPVCACMAVTAGAEPQFGVSMVETGPAVKQTVLAAYLSSEETADLVVASVTEDEKRTIRLYGVNEGFFSSEPWAELPVPKNAILIDVCENRHPEARDSLVFFTKDGVVRFDPANGKLMKLADVTSIYTTPIRDSLPAMNFCRDLNGDERDDLIIPDFDGFEIYIGTDNGFEKSISVEAPPRMEMSYEDDPWYQPHAVYRADMNFDDRTDLVFWVDDRFVVYPQKKDGFFSDEVLTVETGIPFQFEGVRGLSMTMGEEDQSNSESRALYQLVDLDGDGITDLVTLKVTSKGVFSKQTTYEMHKGLNTGEHVRFDEDPFTFIRSDGIQYEMEEKDFDQDGQLDVVTSSVRLGLARVLTALITGSIGLDLQFYRMKDGRYAEKPNVTRRITASFDFSTGDIFFPSVLIGDVDGDGLADLMVQEGTNELKVYPGQDGSDLFARKSIDFDIAVPKDPDLVRLADLNRDGKQDVLLQHEKPHRVVVLMSR